MTKQNYVILGIILIIVFVLAGAVLVREKQKEPAPIPQKPPISQPPVITPPPIVTPPTNPTSPTTSTPEGWKTYENKEFGFAFDYPGEWGVIEKKSKVNYYSEKEEVAKKIDSIILEFENQNFVVDITAYQTDEEKKQFEESTQRTPKENIIKSLGNIIGVLSKGIAGKEADFFIKNTSVGFTALNKTDLNMDIINTIRFIGKKD